VVVIVEELEDGREHLLHRRAFAVSLVFDPSDRLHVDAHGGPPSCCVCRHEGRATLAAWRARPRGAFRIALLFCSRLSLFVLSPSLSPPKKLSGPRKNPALSSSAPVTKSPSLGHILRGTRCVSKGTSKCPSFVRLPRIP